MNPKILLVDIAPNYALSLSLSRFSLATGSTYSFSRVEAIPVDALDFRRVEDSR